MKILQLIFLATILFVNQVFAANIKERPVKPGKEIQSIQEGENKDFRRMSRKYPVRVDWNHELDLDDEQTAYVAEIYKKSHEKIDELMKQIKDIHAQIEAIHEEDEQQILRILTPAQKIKYEKVKRKMLMDKGEKPEGPKPSRKKMPKL